MPELYKELDALQDKLEKHYHDMQDMEFTVQEGKLWFLQTRNGKRTGTAMVKIAMDLLHEGMIDEKTALLRCEPNKLDELLHPVFDKAALKAAKVITQGLPASPGAACGQIVFHADDAEKWHADGHKVIMVRIETSPEDLAGMSAAEGILTARGGMTSHAAVVARGMGKCCVSGAGEIHVDYKAKTVEIGGVVYKEGDYISLNGTTGQVYAGQIATKEAEVSGDFKELMDLCDKYTKMEVRTNADTPHDAQVARNFGAKGIGLTRTEHMFFEGDKIKAMREMIVAKDVENFVAGPKTSPMAAKLAVRLSRGPGKAAWKGRKARPRNTPHRMGFFRMPFRSCTQFLRSCPAYQAYMTTAAIFNTGRVAAAMADAAAAAPDPPSSWENGMPYRVKLPRYRDWMTTAI